MYLMQVVVKRPINVLSGSKKLGKNVGILVLQFLISKFVLPVETKEIFRIIFPMPNP